MYKRQISIALGGIIACGLVYTVIGLVVMKIGTRWIERLMPPVVTGAVVMAIGLNLAPIAVKSVSASAFDSWMAVMTVLCIGLVAVFTRGMIQRLLILVGLIVACLPVSYTHLDVYKRQSLRLSHRICSGAARPVGLGEKRF